MEDPVCPHCKQNDADAAEIDQEDHALLDQLIPRGHRFGQVGSHDMIFGCLNCDNYFAFNVKSGQTVPLGPLDRKAMAGVF